MARRRKKASDGGLEAMHLAPDELETGRGGSDACGNEHFNQHLTSVYHIYI